MEPQLTGQGTRLSEKAPWETYGQEMEAKMSPELAQAVADYADSHYEEGQTSNQNKEELQRQRESNNQIAKEYQWLKEDEYEDIEQRIGVVMHAVTFLEKLRKSGFNCWYAEHPHPDKCVLFIAREGEGYGGPEKVCWVPIGYMPELSIMNFDEHGVPLAERRRGWRTCLLQMILAGFITEEQAVKVFGAPKQTEAFHRYNSTLYEWRNRKFTVE